MTAEKVRENRLRRMAERQGFGLKKSRRRDRRARDYGELWLLWLESPDPDQSNDAWVGPFRDEGGLSALDHLEAWLTADENERATDERYLRGRQLPSWRR